MSTVRNFFWKVTHPAAIRTLELFIKLAVYRGLHHNDVLEEVLEQYNQRYVKEYCPKGLELVDETELLARLELAGLKVSHTLLMKYKRERKLDVTPPLFWTNGVRVVYDFPRCRDWFEEKLTQA